MSPVHELSTTVEIDAPPEAVWTVLTDFDRYDEWNPFMRVHGRPNLGARLLVELTPPGRRTARFRPTVLVVDRAREFRWLGHLAVPGVFDGEHRFALEPLDGGVRTRFVHSESFSGLLAGGLLRLAGEATGDGFRAMNDALKARVESSDATGADGPDEHPGRTNGTGADGATVRAGDGR